METFIAGQAASFISTVGLVIVALVLIIAAIFLFSRLHKILENTVLGLLALLVINYFGKQFGISIAINFVTIIISALLGLAGVGLIILLHLIGVKL